MATVFDLLKRIEARPSMYLGGDSDSRGAQLKSLVAVLNGYYLALETHEISEEPQDFLREFGSYLRSRFQWSMSCGPIDAIVANSSNESEAWEQFWEFLSQFRSHLNSASNRK